MSKFVICWIFFLFWTHVLAQSESTNTSFEIDYDNNQFLLDGKPFRFASGSFHYFRTPKIYWRDRLRKLRAAGLNAISTYVEWSLHQPEPQEWVWDGEADIVEFINLAKEEDLLVLLRPGPYICAERDFGGLPYWLLSLAPDIKIRTSDERFMLHAEKYWNEILRRTQPLLRGNGGPIIMVQIENEYGSFYACDHNYTQRLAEIARTYVGDAAVLYTTDGSYEQGLKCGPVPGVYATVDFGTHDNVTESFELMRRVTAKGPLVNSEFYPGWLSHWGEPFPRVPTSKVVSTLNEILKTGASVNFYMFYGGTNFAFTSGANTIKNYEPDLTSYDYDAPLTEAGDPTEKYFAIKSVISQYLPIPNIPDPVAVPKGNYGEVILKPVLRLFDPVPRKLFGIQEIQSDDPLTFEAMNMSFWLALYETDLEISNQDMGSKFDPILSASPRDRALVYLNDRFAGTLSRTREINSLPLNTKHHPQARIGILVENQGRVNFDNVVVEEFKGLFDVRVNNVSVKNWKNIGFPFDKSRIDKLFNYLQNNISVMEYEETLFTGPRILIGHFDIPNEEPKDTFLNTDGWGKGIALINGHNLGRYWPLIGPQLTLYVPGDHLKTGKNTLILIELEYVPKSSAVNFQEEPILDYPETSKAMISSV